jgi:hypothetical protein
MAKQLVAIAGKIDGESILLVELPSTKAGLEVLVSLPLLVSAVEN